PNTRRSGPSQRLHLTAKASRGFEVQRLSGRPCGPPRAHLDWPWARRSKPWRPARSRLSPKGPDLLTGGMAERPMALVLKTSNTQVFEGSNPSPSALTHNDLQQSVWEGKGARKGCCWVKCWVNASGQLVDRGLQHVIDAGVVVHRDLHRRVPHQ